VGTRGRALAEGAREVKIAGSYVKVRAEVSAHALADEVREQTGAAVVVPRLGERVLLP
jgi:metallo-beta-lactamase family protein